jgi:hypothetical protein
VLVLLGVLGCAWVYVLSAVWRSDAAGLLARLGPLAVGICTGLILIVVALAVALAHLPQPAPHCPGCYGHAPFVAHPDLKGQSAVVQVGNVANRPGHSTTVETEVWVWAIVGLAIAVGLATLGFVYFRRRRRDPDIAEEPSFAAVERFVAESLDDLRRERDLRKAIVASYARMERLMSGSGMRRERFEAPFEYLARVVGDLPGGRRAIGRLTVLYEEAEFSTHRLSERMRVEAIESLVDLRAACGAR